MTITIFLVNDAIKDKNDDEVKDDLHRIIINCGGQVKTSSLSPYKIESKGRWFNVELMDITIEDEVANRIRQEQYNNSVLKPKIYHEIIIKNILISESKKDIEKLCQKYVDDKQITKINCKPSGAYISLKSRQDAENLVANLHDIEWNGRRLSVTFAQIIPTKQPSEINSLQTKENLDKREITSDSDSLSTNQTLEINNLQTTENLDKRKITSNSYSLETFYRNRDYDLVTKNLRTLIYEMCKYLSNPVSKSEINQQDKQ
ncbi:MAG TPA: RNA-binding protein [Nostocaceae cyanobacterium]|nr:RNA-binding protein [Nostocaceae cyanobacterium]